MQLQKTLPVEFLLKMQIDPFFTFVPVLYYFANKYLNRDSSGSNDNVLGFYLLSNRGSIKLKDLYFNNTGSPIIMVIFFDASIISPFKQRFQEGVMRLLSLLQD